MTAPSSFNIDNPQHWTISRVVLTQADRHPDKTAIEFVDGNSWTFADCKRQGLLAAAVLKKSGVRSNDAVAMMIDSPEQFARYWLGLSFLGTTMVAINTGMRGSLLKHQLDISESRFLITTEQYRNCLLYTSPSPRD